MRAYCNKLSSCYILNGLVSLVLFFLMWSDCVDYLIFSSPFFSFMPWQISCCCLHKAGVRLEVFNPTRYKSKSPSVQSTRKYGARGGKGAMAPNFFEKFSIHFVNFCLYSFGLPIFFYFFIFSCEDPFRVYFLAPSFSTDLKYCMAPMGENTGDCK